MGELTVSPCSRGQKPGANVLSAVLVRWVAALVPKSENDARIWYKPIHLNPTGLPVGAVSILLRFLSVFPVLESEYES